MAEEKKTSRRIKKVESVRERAEKIEKPKKTRRIRQVTASASGGLKAAGTKARKEYHPIKLPDNRLGKFLSKSRRATPRFFSDAWAELRQVTWPNRQETAKMTVAVIVFAFVFGGLIAITDYGLEKLFRQLLDLN